jgi:hypothetical protein
MSHQLRLSASLTLGAGPARRRGRFAAVAALGATALMALASVVGLTVSSTYAGETEAWRIQGLGQDWTDLLVATPWMLVAALGALRGSRRARLLLAGGLLYTTYSFVIYAFAVHFNPLFLIYCAVLGLSLFSLASLGRDLVRDDAHRWFDGREPRRAAAGLLMGSAVLFAGLWLLQIVPALLAGRAPANLAETGLLTNPVHVLDLSFVLPAMFLCGLWLWRRHPPGFATATALLGFAALMDVNIAALIMVTMLHGLPAEPALIAVFAALAAATATLLALMLRAVRAPPAS